MGVIIRQGIRHAFVNYLGAGIGVISMLFVYPLETEAYGLVRFLADSVILFIPITLLGSNVLPVRFFPTFENKESGHAGFLGWLLLISLIGSVLTMITAWLIWDPVIQYYGNVSRLYEQFLIYIIPILILRALIQLLITYISNFHKIAVPSFLNDLLFKISLPIFILLVHFGQWGLRGLVIGIVAHFAIVLISLIGYLMYLGEWSLRIHWPSYHKDLLKEMGEYGIYGFAATISSTIAVNIDLFMIGSMISPLATGIYGIASIMTNLINRPHVAISLIAAPIIAKAWQDNNLPEIAGIYRKSAINSLIPGVLLFLLIWLNLPDIYQIMPNPDVIAQNKTVILILSAAFLFNLSTGVNSEIMIYSSLFKLHLYAVLLLSVCNIGLNWWLIREMGISGAAVATMISYVVYNLFKCSAIYYRMAMHPFSWAMIWVAIIATGIGVLAMFYPEGGNPVLQMLIRSVLICVLFIAPVYFLRLAPDFNGIIDKIVHRLIRK